MSARPEFTQLRYDVADHVATIRFNRAERMNALTRVMEQELYDAMQAADKDEAVRVIVLTGEGRAFCAGMDMAELAELPADDIYDPSRMRAFDTRARPDFQGRYNYFPALAKPVIAAINGAAAGLGLIYALCADMRFASNGAAFSTAFSRRGLIGEHGAAWLLTHTVGPGKAADLLLSARKVGAEEALSMGLVDRVIAAESLGETVRAYAVELANAVSPRSLRVIKRQLWASRFQTLSEALQLANAEMVESFRSEDFTEGVAHFVEKRPARFTGR
tara:strand:+ start:747 stop:1571 length:825 start_codon:yes stop_codon:yes gene_type:complete